ncbi:efflux RND transporter periplasmic adaptor subunit [Methylococcus geothermalis]|uniref:Efflux RND transporter periplasmic adaptor subunit n=1 Tax=Methylococcus geothermalis TaxID=2681310 RepID=A0A858Q945_9GAMM|nr:efflux RND transporter periplasmic adaptor subunit [Methylococcus geothermalis]
MKVIQSGTGASRLLGSFRFPFSLFVLLTPLAGCSDHGDSNENTATTKSVAAVAPVVRADLISTRNIASEFEPYQQVDVHAKVAGYVKRIDVDIGDAVKEGQVLAVLEVPELEEDLARAHAAVLRARERIRLVRSNIHRAEAIAYQAELTYKRMYSVNQTTPNLVAQQEIDIARSQADATAAELSSRKAAALVAEQELAEAQAEELKAQALADYATIRAPFTGIVTKRYADTGAMVPQGIQSSQQAMPVVRITQVDPLRLSFPVPESMVSLVHTDAPVTVHVPSLNRTFDGKIWRFTGKTTDITRTMETQLLIPNPRFELKPGMLASVEFVLARRDQVLAIPVEAVDEDGKEPTVLVVGPDGKVEDRKLKLGIKSPNRYEVISGLAENEKVIVAGHSRFVPGQIVQTKTVSFDVPAADDGQ